MRLWILTASFLGAAVLVIGFFAVGLGVGMEAGYEKAVSDFVAGRDRPIRKECRECHSFEKGVLHP
jgi:hypothetical protein